MSKTVVALCRVRRNPEGKMKFTGEYDLNGDPVVRSDGQRLMPGDVFQIEDDAEFQHLLSLDAVRELNDVELALFERNPAALRFDPAAERARVAERHTAAIDERYPVSNS